MTMGILARGERTSPLVFWLGVGAVAAGVGLHFPSFVMARQMGYRLAGMAMDPMMIVGMGLIVFGTGAAAYGLMPARLATSVAVEASDAGWAGNDEVEEQ